MYVKVQLRVSKTGEEKEVVIAWSKFQDMTFSDLALFSGVAETGGKLDQVTRSPQYNTVRHARKHEFTSRDRTIIGKSTIGDTADE